MDLLVLSSRYWPEGGGAELATHLIVDLLAQEKEMRITVLTGTRNPVRTQGVNFILSPGLGAMAKPSSWVHSRLPSFRRYFEKLVGAFDLVYVCQAYPLIPLAKSTARKVIVHIHDYQPVSYNAVVMAPAFQEHLDPLNQVLNEGRYEITEHGNPGKALIGSLLAPTVAMYRYWTDTADLVICVSRRQAEIISHFAPELENKIKIIRNPLPPVGPVQKESISKTRFLYVGGDSHIKGFQVFLQASQRLLSENVDATFLLTKQLGKASRSIIQDLNRLATGQTYILSGRLDYAELMRLHSVASALIFPSIWEETWGYAVMEAMLSGTIPIASNVGGVAELVDGTPAQDYLFEPGDIGGLASLMGDVASLSRERLVDISQRLRQSTLKKFCKDTTRNDLLAVLS